MLALSSLRSLATTAPDIFPVDRHVPLAIGAAAVMAVLITFGTSRDPPAPSVAFAERWSLTPNAIVAKPVRTVSILPETNTVPALPEIDGFIKVPMPPRPIAPVANASAKVTDICRGKGRIYIRGGRSWRCRR